MFRVIDQVSAVEAFGFQGSTDIATETVIADTAQPADAPTQACQADGHVGVGPGDAALKMLDVGQFSLMFGNEHCHGLTEGQYLWCRVG